MKLYIYSKCSTCKDALKFLEKNGVKFDRLEITETPPSISELKAMLGFKDGNIRKIFNTSGLLYKEMKLSEKLDNLSEKEALELLSKNGMLVKRPFLITKDFGLTGFNEKDWAAQLK